jgi:acetyl esterase/lipase
MYLYLLRPMSKTDKVLPAIVYFTGGGWVNGNVRDKYQMPLGFAITELLELMLIIG